MKTFAFLIYVTPYIGAGLGLFMLGCWAVGAYSTYRDRKDDERWWKSRAGQERIAAQWVADQQQRATPEQRQKQVESLWMRKALLCGETEYGGAMLPAVPFTFDEYQKLLSNWNVDLNYERNLNSMGSRRQ